MAHLFFSGAPPALPDSGSAAFQQEPRLKSGRRTCPNAGKNLLATLFLSKNPQSARESCPSPPPGIILLDEEKFVVSINRSARELLGPREENSPGRLFNYFITPNTPLQVGITRKDGSTGLGEMIMQKNKSSRQSPYLVTIREI